MNGKLYSNSSSKFWENLIYVKQDLVCQQQQNLFVRPDMVAVVSCTFSFFVFLFNFILLETIGTPLCMQQLGWSEETRKDATFLLYIPVLYFLQPTKA